MGITAVTVNGTAIDLADVVYEISVSHGRNDIQSAPQASDARVLLRGFSTIPAVIGDVIQIDAYSESRFTGTVTDITLTHGYSWQDQENPLLELLCTGHMAKLGYIFVGETGYAAGQTLKNRVEAIMSDTGLVNYTNVAPYLEQKALANQDGGYNALTLLTDLGTQVGGTVGDFPDGTVFWESYSSRGYGYNPSTWLDVTDQWENVPYSWADVYQSTDGFPVTVTLDNDVTVWEPVWKNNLQTVLNDVTVTYRTNSSTNSTDADSIALYGRRSTTVATQLQHAGDATDRADEIIRAQAQPHYALQNVQILVHNLTNPKLGQVLGLLSGSRVQINDVPPPHPLEDYLGVVEGWTEVYTPGQHILTLSLSDPRYSYAVAQWGQVSATLTWGTTNASVQWYNVVLPSDLLAA